jgi:hypothetical protein
MSTILVARRTFLTGSGIASELRIGGLIHVAHASRSEVMRNFVMRKIGADQALPWIHRREFYQRWGASVTFKGFRARIIVSRCQNVPVSGRLHVVAAIHPPNRHRAPSNTLLSTLCRH